MRTIKSELERLGFSKQNKQSTKQSNKNRKPKETLTDRDLAELMGTNRATYRRGRGGAFRQR